MRLRTLTVLSLSATGLAVSAAPAGSANQMVTATPSNTFTPRLVAVRPGESVTFHNGGGFHNVAWDDGFHAQPAPPNQSDWTVTRSFSGTGTHPFFCQIHGARGVHGMAGIVFVTPSGALPKPAITTASAVGQVHSVRLTFRSTQPGALSATISRGSALFGRLGGFVGYGSNVRRVLRTSAGRALSPGTYRISLRVRSSAGLSAPRTLTVSVH